MAETTRKRTTKTRKQRAVERLQTTDRLLKRANMKLLEAEKEVRVLN
jgi:hypothetical protein